MMKGLHNRIVELDRVSSSMMLLKKTLVES